MGKRLFLALAVWMSVMAASAKTLVVYYSYTNNVHRIVTDLRTQIDADVIRVEPAEKGLDYAANNYAIGSAQIAAIRNHPDDASSYPSIDPVQVNMSEYNMVIVAAPLWWSNMAAPMQSFLFQYGKQMAGKKIGLIVSSASSGISSVVADAKRLIPNGDFLTPNLWIRSSQVSSCHSMTEKWLNDIDYKNITSGIASVFTGAVDAKVEITSTGVNVLGAFDTLVIYNANGQKMLETSKDKTAHSFRPGCYVAQLKKGNQVSAVKLIVK